MRGKRVLLVLLIGLGLVAAILVALVLWTPAPPVAEQPTAQPPAAAPKTTLQADAAGSYVPSYRFGVNGFRFTSITLRPDPFVTFVRSSAGTTQEVACLEVTIRTESVHLRCDDPQVGTVIIDGRFLTRVATSRLEAPALSAVVMVRSGSGDVLYRARDAFQWRPAE